MSREEEKQEKTKRVVVFICNGIIEGAYSTDPDLDFTVVDYDKDIDDEDALDKLFDELEEEFTSYFDLVLAGHTHNGQVWLPFFQDLILPPYGKKYIKGNYQLNATTSLYISGGLGCSTFNYRLGNPPSINFYRTIKE